MSNWNSKPVALELKQLVVLEVRGERSFIPTNFWSCVFAAIGIWHVIELTLWR